jgi:hypothetical protein
LGACLACCTACWEHAHVLLVLLVFWLLVFGCLFGVQLLLQLRLRERAWVHGRVRLHNHEGLQPAADDLGAVGLRGSRVRGKVKRRATPTPTAPSRWEARGVRRATCDTAPAARRTAHRQSADKPSCGSSTAAAAGRGQRADGSRYRAVACGSRSGSSPPAHPRPPRRRCAACASRSGTG